MLHTSSSHVTTLILQKLGSVIQELNKKERRGAPDKYGFQTITKKGELPTAAAGSGGKGFEGWGLLKSHLQSLTVDSCWEVGWP